MIETRGNIWDFGQVVCITTNGTIKANGCGVMGRGVARQALMRIPGIDARLGEALRRHGNHVQCLRIGAMIGSRLIDLFAFPVKRQWWQEADTSLIAQSAHELAEIAARSNAIFVLPRPGCGNGGLTWEVVRPIIVDILPDNVVVVEYGAMKGL